jgi:hypothetical protein
MTRQERKIDQVADGLDGNAIDRCRIAFVVIGNRFDQPKVGVSAPFDQPASGACSARAAVRAGRFAEQRAREVQCQQTLTEDP